MAEIIKSIKDIETIFKKVVLTILNLNPKTNPKRVRTPWGARSNSAPSFGRDEDVCFVYVLPQDNSYTRQRNKRYVDRGGRDLVEIEEYIEVHHINFSNYGPNAYECARDIRDGLFSHEIRRFLREHNISLIPDVSAMVRVPELIQSEWWNRVDISARFNEFVRRECEMPVIENISINVKNVNKDGEVIREEIIERSYNHGKIVTE